MPTDTQNTLNPKDARIAGALYLTIAVCGGFSIGYVPAQIVVAGDARNHCCQPHGAAWVVSLGRACR